MTKPNALIGMSGGVDSSVAAFLTAQAGYGCIGATMLLHEPEAFGGAKDAQSVAERMGIPFHIIDLSATFREKVMDAFVNSYEAGLTPNPCIVCNRYLKFGCFLEEAFQLGCEKVVTGHYARIAFDPESGRHLLKKAADEAKDQSYFLYTLTQHQLSHTLFPLGELTKEQVRAIALEQNFVNAKKQDSQDICFVPDGDYLAFMEQYTGKRYPAGDFLDLSGAVVGRHKGCVGYTIGQRKGLGLAMGEPVYVCGKDMAANTVTVGPNDALWGTTLEAGDMNWISIDRLQQPMRVLAKARSRMTEQPAQIIPGENGRVTVIFDQPQRAITPGQAVVFYDGDTVIGGGTILSAK